ncbi:UDP-N-acetylmuramoyl-tripeptide--D-alanyl-D-alanine ligase [Kocuria coralli]|uniref:UDP-N-acetylmuramoyl-tripeptide--D-alanyl-D-alanine ligase n=1 Tax=Kocuria coralli TaxID=1461025 RepID=A0A5J5L058_9MICC|nr:UDP-N-acetylmuramoyl-tripeptide--D-alanyl-D-alanine ligase [Kocuria coralli]KAA9394426.1 UDP-N-acetylmuramoyl-tripeptide--D-alanyl-D-alanine ligase [Kocuria coralli]
MIPLNAHRIAEITGGTVLGLDNVADAELPVIDHVTTDSREVVDGTLFVAKPGEVTDGHVFVGKAFDGGARLALVERPVAAEDATVFPSVQVDDVVEAMGALAHWVVEYLRERRELQVVAVTGSVGKTTTKDLLRSIFASEGPTVAPRGSYNGEVGLPLTVFTATEDTRYLVVEMGATHIGNIEYLCGIARPDVGVVLCVGSAHAGEFGGVENIAIAKGELVESLTPQGVAVLNEDDPRVRGMRTRTQAPVVLFGTGEGQGPDAADDVRVRASDISTDDDGHPSFTLHFPDGSEHRVVSGLIGAHHVSNILAAAAAAFVSGIAPETIVGALRNRGAGSRWRMERTERPDGVSVINDAYNANPQSMRAALQTLAELGRPRGDKPSRRTWAILGGMLELGDVSVDEHDAIGRQVVRLNISKLIAVGEVARPVYNAAHLEGSWGNEATWVPDAEAAEALLAEELAPGDIVLFKSSNAAGLNRLGDRVAAADGATAREPAAANDAPSVTGEWLSAGDSHRPGHHDASDGGSRDAETGVNPS